MKTGYGAFDRSGGASVFSSTETVARAHVSVDDYQHALANTSISRAYTVLWLDWHVNGVDHEDVFHGEPSLSGVDTSAVRLQYKAPGSNVIADFDSVANVYSTKYAMQTTKAAKTLFGTGDDYVFTSPHDTDVRWIRWAAGTNHTVGFKPDDDDFSGYDSLSFRVGVMFDSDHNDGSDLDFEIRLRDNDGDSFTVDLATYAEVRYPIDNELPTGLGVLAGNYSKSGMQTVRVPLADFSGVDLSDIYSVEFRFNTDGGEITVDDIRATP